MTEKETKKLAALANKVARAPKMIVIYEKMIEFKDKKKFVIESTHHVTTVDEGVIFDTWDTSNETVWAFWYK